MSEPRANCGAASSRRSLALAFRSSKSRAVVNASSWTCLSATWRRSWHAHRGRQMTLEGIACLIAGFTARSVALAITSCDHTATRSRLTSKSRRTATGRRGHRSPSPPAGHGDGTAHRYHLKACLRSGTGRSGLMGCWPECSARQHPAAAPARHAGAWSAARYRRAGITGRWTGDGFAASSPAPPSGGLSRRTGARKIDDTDDDLCLQLRGGDMPKPQKHAPARHYVRTASGNPRSAAGSGRTMPPGRAQARSPVRAVASLGCLARGWPC